MDQSVTPERRQQSRSTSAADTTIINEPALEARMKAYADTRAELEEMVMKRRLDELQTEVEGPKPIVIPVDIVPNAPRINDYEFSSQHHMIS